MCWEGSRDAYRSQLTWRTSLAGLIGGRIAPSWRIQKLLAASEVGGGGLLSPDGSKVAFGERHPENETSDANRITVGILDVASGEVLARGISGDFVQWSGDGEFLTTRSERAGPCGGRELALFRAETGELITCLDGAVELSWSPSGAQFFYFEPVGERLSRPAAINDLLLFDAATGESRILARDVAIGCFDVDWSRDGRFLTIRTLCGI